MTQTDLEHYKIKGNFLVHFPLQLTILEIQSILKHVHQINVNNVRWKGTLNIFY